MRSFTSTALKDRLNKLQFELFCVFNVTMKLGSFVELNSGKADFPFVAQIVAVDKVKNLLLCRWLFRPEDLPEVVMSSPRERGTFSLRELVLCDAEAAVKTDDWNPPTAILREVKVVKGLPRSDFDYFYRQTLDPAIPALRPELVADIFHAHGKLLVENPDDAIYQCVVCEKKYHHSVIEQISRKKFPGYTEFTCAECARASWPLAQPPADEKRLAVVRKFESAMNLAVSEMQGRMPEFVENKIPGLAAALEAALWEKSDYWPRARSLVFNLNDAKNPSLRRRVILGELPLARIISADAVDLANEELRQQRLAQQEKYYHEQVLLARAADDEPDAKKQKFEEYIAPVNALEALIIAPPPLAQPVQSKPVMQPEKPKLSAMAAELLRDCESISNPRIRLMVKIVIKQ